MADKPYVSPSKLKRFFIGLLGEKLNTKEEITANTDVDKFAGAMAVQEIYEGLNDSLGKKVVCSTVELGEKFTGHCRAIVINGVAYISLEVTPSGEVAHGDVVVSGLPKPFASWTTSLGLDNGNVYTSVIIENELTIYFPSYKTKGRVDACFSYPVAE